MFHIVHTYNYTSILCYRYLFDEGIEKRINILPSNEREMTIYTSVGHAMKFQLAQNGKKPSFLLHYEGKKPKYLKLGVGIIPNI